MNATAARAGLRRGVTEYGISLRTPSEVAFTLVGVAAGAIVLWIFRDDELVPGIGVSSFIVPSLLVVQLVFVAAYGLATVVVTEREDGTLLRARSLPGGLRMYAVGATTRTMLELALSFATTIVLAIVILGDRLGLDVVGTLQAIAMLLLGTLALTPFGFVIGSVFRNPRSVGGWGFLVVGAIVFASGLITPLANLPAWAQVIGLVLPLYWIGHVLRDAFLPADLAVIEVGGSWQPGIAFAVVGAWAVVGLVLAPRLLRRVARRETGSAIEARRQAALQRA